MKKFLSKRGHVIFGGCTFTLMGWNMYRLGYGMLEVGHPGLTLRGVCGGVMVLLLSLIFVLVVAWACIRIFKLKNKTAQNTAQIIFTPNERKLVFVTWTLCMVIGVSLAQVSILDSDFRHMKAFLEKRGIRISWQK